MEVCAEGRLLFLVTLFSSALGAPTLSVDANPSIYGTTETLKCTDATYSFGHDYIWEKDGNTIFTHAGEESTSGKYSESIDGTTFKLVINDIVVSDEGTYSCNHNFAASDSLNLQVESRGNVSAVLLSSKYLEVTFKQIFPDTNSAIITCDSTIKNGSFVNSVADGDRFIKTWKSMDTFLTEPTSCSAKVTLRTTFITALTVTSAPTVEIYVCPGLGNSTIVDSEAECAGCWIVIGLASLLVVLYLIGIVLGCILKYTTCCCVCFYEGESCRKCAKYKCCYCGCCAPTPCGACCIIGGLPPWYKRLWASAIGIPIAFGIWVVWICCGQEERQVLRRPQPPLPAEANSNPSQSPNKRDRANSKDDDHLMLRFNTPAQKAGALESITDSAREEVTKKKKKKKRRVETEDD